ncbi:MAG: ribosomal protein [Rickettsiaceae bacterium]|jgi:small subunit ribosomal protein S20|nr:ribosomal protein [Rickettsiaceae bacterium]
MANHSSAKKAYRQTVKKTLINKSRKSMIKTFIKKVESAINSGAKTEASEALVKAQSEIMKGVKNNVLKLNTASRKISRLSLKIKSLA